VGLPLLSFLFFSPIKSTLWIHDVDPSIFDTAATTFLAGKEFEEQKWVHPIIDARKGRLRSSAGRMGKDEGDGNEKYGDDPYAGSE
jgi:hypothetical protein